MIRELLMVGGIALATAGAAPTAGTGARPRVAPAQAASVAVDDERRAAATRLLAASRFRERQEVQAEDGLRAARADLTAECVTRAAEGRSLAECRATAAPDAATAARLAASRAAMLDEVMAATQTIYARRFTAAEMNEITRFFSTPVGRKYAAEYTRVLDEVGARRRTIARRYLVAASRPRGGRAGS